MFVLCSSNLAIASLDQTKYRTGRTPDHVSKGVSGGTSANDNIGQPAEFATFPRANLWYSCRRGDALDDLRGGLLAVCRMPGKETTVMDVIVSLLDKEHQDLVNQIWRELEVEFGLRGVYATRVPHFSYHVARQYNFSVLQPALTQIAAAHTVFQVRTAGLGIFTGPQPVLYIPVVRTSSLNRLARRAMAGHGWRSDRPCSALRSRPLGTAHHPRPWRYPRRHRCPTWCVTCANATSTGNLKSIACMPSRRPANQASIRYGLSSSAAP